MAGRTPQRHLPAGLRVERLLTLCSLLVDQRLGQLAELSVGLGLLVERRLQQLRYLVLGDLLRPRDRTAIS